MALAGLRNLCTPAYVYLVISMITILIMILQNLGGKNIYCLGVYECEVMNLTLIFIIKILYVLFWTWILNLICKENYATISWLLVLIPYLMFFILIGTVLFQ